MRDSLNADGLIILIEPVLKLEEKQEERLHENEEQQMVIR